MLLSSSFLASKYFTGLQVTCGSSEGLFQSVELPWF